MFSFVPLRSVLLISIFCHVAYMWPEPNRWPRPSMELQRILFPNNPWGVSMSVISSGGRVITYCEGSLITNDVIVTAAECLQGAEVVNVDLERRGRVQSYVFNYPFGRNGVPYGIGLVKLPQPVYSQDMLDVKPIPPITFDLARGTSLMAFSDYASGDSTVPLVNLYSSECNTYGFRVNSMDGCALPVNKQDACSLKPGTGLVLENQGRPMLVGVAINDRNGGCQQGFPIPYIKLETFLDWIRSNPLMY